MFIFKNSIFYFLIISLIIIISISQSNFIYYFFHENYLPVFDGVMNEKNQILRYLSFKGNFSLIERYNQLIYEFKGNPVSGGFNSLLILLDPNFLINDYDIILRSFFSLLFLYYSLISFFNLKLSKKTILFLILISQVPVFFHYRIGLSSYVPDLTSSIFLFSSYFFIFNYLTRNKIFFLSLGLLSLLLAIFSRFNFFVYASLIYIPMVPLLVCSFKKLDLKSKKVLFNFIFIFLLLVFVVYYIFYHFNDFMSYYSKPASYAKVTLRGSLYSVYSYFCEELGFQFIFLIACLLLITNIINNDNKFKFPKYYNLLLLSPIVFILFFLLFVVNATNTPHVYTLLVIFFIPIGFLKINVNSNRIIIFLLIFIFFLLSGINFYSKYKEIKNHQIKCNSILLANQIEKYSNEKEKKSYFILFDTAQEIPLDVYFFKKNRFYNDNILRFYFTDWDYYSIDKKLNFKTISAYYIRSIEKHKPKLIFANNFQLKFSNDRKLAKNINLFLCDYFRESNFYSKVGECSIQNKTIDIYKLN